MIGREGMTDIISTGRAPMRAIVQASGEAYRIDATIFASAVSESPSLAGLLLRYQLYLLTQVAYTALSHGSFTVPQRLARWLLMAHDRVDGDEIEVVHDFMAWMLGVRRAGITEAISQFKANGCIDAKRGKIIVLSRELLEEKAAGSYGRPEAEYQRAFAQLALARDG